MNPFLEIPKTEETVNPFKGIVTKENPFIGVTESKEKLPEGFEFNPKTGQIEEIGLKSPGLLDPVEMAAWAMSGGITGLGLPAKALAKRVADWGMLGLPGLTKGIVGAGKGVISGLGAKALEKTIPVTKAMPVKIGAEEIVHAPQVGLGIKTGVEVAKPPRIKPVAVEPTLYRGISQTEFNKMTKGELPGKFWTEDKESAARFAELATTREHDVVNQRAYIIEAQGIPSKLNDITKVTDARTGESVWESKLIKSEIMEPHVKFEPHKEMAEVGTESMIAKGIKRDPDKLMTEQLVEEWLADPSKYQEIASRHGLTVKDFALKLRSEASWHGKYLGEIGLQAQKMGKEIPEIGEALADLEKIARTPGAMDYIQSGWKKFSNTWRGMLVTQLSTAMRNAEVQAGRVGLNIFEEGLNAGLQKVLGKSQTVHPLDGMEQLFRLFQRNKPLTDKVLKEFPKQYDRLFATYMSDIEGAGKLGGTISKGVDILNTANRFQEYTIRRAVFMGKLDQGLKTQGMDLAKIIENNEIGKIPIDTIKSSVNSALEFTFAEQPRWGTLGRKFTDFVTSMPGATLVMPFPRFLMNSLKFQFEYSPLGALQLLSPAERAAFGAGNMEVISRAMLGSAMFGAAWQIRNSEYAGEKAWELQVGGKTIDMRPYNPFVSYLVAADWIKKSKDGTLYKLTGKDIAMGIFSSNLRAGTGLYALDTIVNAVSQTGDSEKAANMVKQFAGEIAGGFATPLNQFKEFASGLDDYVVREKRSEPFLGAIKEKIPILEKTLSPLYSATHEGPVTRELPAIRQITGIMMKEKNEFEKELDRLGFEANEILPSTGNPEADNLIKKYMGKASQEVAVPVMKTEIYKKLDDKLKGLVLKELLEEIRKAGREVAEEENPKLFGVIQLQKTPKREKIFIKEPLEKTIGILKGK